MIRQPPRFSIVICNYNYARYVGEAVESCLSQTYPADAYEVIVVDDGSTDESLQALERFRGDARVQIVTQANGGQAAAFAAGVERATGDYVCLLDSDDVFEPEKLAGVAAKLATYTAMPGDFFLCHDLHLVEQLAGQPARTLPETWFGRNARIGRHMDCLTSSQADSQFPFAVPCGTVFSRGLLRRILRAMPLGEFRISADTPIFWAAMLAAGAVHYLHQPLAVYRAHGENGFITSFASGASFRSDPREVWPRNLWFLEAFLDTLDLSEAERNDRLTLIRRLQRRTRVSAARPRLAEPRLSVLVTGPADPAGWARTLRSVAAQTHANVEVIVPRDNPLELDGGAQRVVPDLALATCDAGNRLQVAVNAYGVSGGEYFVLVSAGDTLDRTFAERHLHTHRYAELCMVTSSDFRLAGPRGELVHEGCLASTGICRGRVMTRPFERGLQQWSFSPRSANVFRRWPAIDCFFDHLARTGRESSDGPAEWLLLYYAQALGGSFRCSECLSTVSLQPDDRVMDVARGLPAFAAHPALNIDRLRVFLFGLLCTHHEQLLALVTPATLGGFARWLRAGASPQVTGLMQSQAVAAGADPQTVAMLAEDG